MKTLFQSANIVRHKFLEDLSTMCANEGQYSDFPIPLKKAVAFGETKESQIIPRIKASEYLYAGGYINFGKRSGEVHVYMTEKGLSALQSEYFLEKNNEAFRLKKHNTIASISAIVVAFGVLWSLIDSNTNKQDIKIHIQIPPQSKAAIDTIVSVDKKSYSASLVRKDSVAKNK